MTALGRALRRGGGGGSGARFWQAMRHQVFGLLMTGPSSGWSEQLWQLIGIVRT